MSDPFHAAPPAQPAVLPPHAVEFFCGEVLWTDADGTCHRMPDAEYQARLRAQEAASVPLFDPADDTAADGLSGDPGPACADDPEGFSRATHPAGRGWIAVSRDIGLPGESAGDAQAAFAAGMTQEGEGTADTIPPLLFKGGDRGVVADAGAFDSGFDDAQHHPQTRPHSTPGHLAFSLARRVRFAEHLAETGNVRLACAATGVSRHTAYKARRRDDTFAQAWDAALVLAARHAEAVLADRALDGVEEPVWFRGELVGHRRRYDTRLLLAHLGRLDARCARRDDSLAAGRFDELLARLGGMAIDPELAGEGMGDSPIGAAARGSRVPGLALPREEWLGHAGRAAERAATAQAQAEHLTGEACEARIDALYDAALVVAEDRWDAHRAAAFAWVDTLAAGDAAPVAEAEPPLEYKSMEGAPGQGADDFAPDCVTPVTPSSCVTPTRPSWEEGGPSAVEQGQLDRAVSHGDEADPAGGGFGYVDQAAARERAAIVDPHHHGLAAARVGHADLAAERQSAVGGGQVRRIEPFAAGGAAAEQFAAVVAGHAGAQFLAFRFDSGRLDSGERFGHGIGVLADHGGRGGFVQAHDLRPLRAGGCGG